MPRRYLPLLVLPLLLPLLSAQAPARPEAVDPPPVASDPSVKLDYDIVYVRAPRAGDRTVKRFYTEIGAPAYMEPGADLMLLHPDGSEEVLVKGGRGSVTDPFVSFDGEWVYYALFHDLTNVSVWEPHRGGSDIYKMHLKTRKVVQLTHQEYTPNTGAVPRPGVYQYGRLNLGPCPLPGGRIVFTSSRDGFLPPKHSTPMMQLFVMDEDGSNVECIGHLNLGMALHPVVLKDGRIMFSSLESQGLRNTILWGLWQIRPDGTNWGPLISAFDLISAPNAFHFQTQLSDESLIVELYYNWNNSGFGSFLKMPPQAPSGYASFAPAFSDRPDPNLRWPDGDYHLPFRPYGMEVFTRFTHGMEGPSPHVDPKDKSSPYTGKVTHPSGAPDNHLLCVWSPGPVNHQYEHFPIYDGGLYLIKDGVPVDHPNQMRLIKNDPNYNEQFPRAVVSYKRIYGVDEPHRFPELANDGRLSPHLPAGTPYGLVGTSSFYKRESYPNGVVPPNGVTATFAGGHNPWKDLDAFTSHGNGMRNWTHQGGDVGLYSNDEIHAVRILAMEPTSHTTKYYFHNHAQERLRILGEIPLRKFTNGKQPTDPDGNSDTSFLAKIPADTGFTFQTIDKDGLALNLSQTWHQLRPGEIRNNCGGCHAHSQQPTLFEKTAAAKSDYPIFDLTRRAPLITTKANDQIGRQWDADDTTGLRLAAGVQNVEYYRDIQPILKRSCVACHTRDSASPAGNLVLDADTVPEKVDKFGKIPGTYYRLAMDEGGKYGYRPVATGNTWGMLNASRYVRKFQARRSLLAWKILGRRTDGFSNDDFPTERVPGDPNTLMERGKPIEPTHNNRNRADLDFTGSVMPPPEAVAGTYVGPDGQRVRVAPLSDEDKRTIFRWIDLGCPIDLDYDPADPSARGKGWMLDDKRPTLTVQTPRRGANPPVSRLRIGMCDFYTGLDMTSFTVTADFAVAGNPPGRNLAGLFQLVDQGVWELKLPQPLVELPRGTLTVSVKDREGNVTTVERTFSVSPLGR